MSQISVISGKTSEDLAKKIAKKIKANLVKSEIRIFPDGESKITLIGKISKKRSIVIQSIFPPVDSNLVHTLSLITKAKELLDFAGSGKVTIKQGVDGVAITVEAKS